MDFANVVVVILSLNLSQICAVLAAVTEVIRGQGGKETETEYFAALVSSAFCCTFSFNKLTTILSKDPCCEVMVSLGAAYENKTCLCFS